MIIFSCLLSSSICFGSPLCTGKEATLTCLKSNFDELYHTNYHGFFDILYKAEKHAINCKDTSETVAFLELVNYGKQNAEYTEYLREAIENLIQKNPECYFNAVLILDRDTKLYLIDQVRYPLFTEKKEIEHIFTKYKKNERYKEIMDIYFKNGKTNKCD